MSSTTPNMSLVIPTVGNSSPPDGGPGYATEINAALILVDAHDHSSGKGAPVTQNGLNLTGDLTFGSNAALNLSRAGFISQAAALTNIRSIYSVLGELYYTDGSGNQVKITASGAVNTGGSGNLSGMDGSAAVTYSAITKTFAFTQSSGFPAKIATGDHLFFETTSGASQTITLKAPAGLANTFTLTFPGALPATTVLPTFTSAGVMAFLVAPASTSLLQSTSGGAISYVTTLPSGLTIPSPVLSGTVSGTYVLGGTPTDSNNNAVVGEPAGVIKPFAGITVPTGYLFCDGTSELVASFTALASAITVTTTGSTHTNTTIDSIPGAGTAGWGVGMTVMGTNIPANTTIATIASGSSITISNPATGTTAGGVLIVVPFGTADSSGTAVTTLTHFNLPDGRGRTLIGVGRGSALTLRVLGGSLGEETHVLSVTELPAHTHQVSGGQASSGSTAFSKTSTNTVSPETTDNGTGGGGAHNTMQPSLAVNWIIKT